MIRNKKRGMELEKGKLVWFSCECIELRKEEILGYGCVGRES